MLSAFPLAVEWLRVDVGTIGSGQPQKGSFAVVGSFLPEIEIWNLDLAEAVEPDVVLGGEVLPKGKPRKFTNKVKKYRPGSHTDAVCSVSGNKANLGVLASGSVDQTVKVWDIGKQVCVHTAGHHQGPVKVVEWSATDVSVLLSASADGRIAVLDSRFPDDRIEHSLTNG